MKNFLLAFLCTIVVGNLFAQSDYRIDINRPEKEILRGHLDLGGANPAGDKIEVNSYFIEKNDEAFFPVLGEFHYSRYPEEYWEESIRKMKAGGINVIASYVFWNIHERQEGTFDWSANLNLRKFIELIEKNGLYAIVRMGPFCHGEMRNGGIPDWLYGRTFEIRSNDSEYLFYVDRLYGEIASQIEGLLFKDGGPVIGVQLENEYQHSAAPWEFGYIDSKKERTVADWEATLVHDQITVTDGVNSRVEYGRVHMKKLKEIAKNNGIDVPLYTATGWGNATIVERGSLPVTAGYAYPFWSDPHLSSFYLFKDIQKYPDYMPVSYETELYPSIPAEIGPGIQVKYTRRPVVDYRSISPLMVRIIGSGSNGIGYYMYHGGSTPSFDGKFYNEEKNGIPRINYDFQAPIGQYGQTRYHYRSLRMLHMFLDSYGTVLAPMKTLLPETNASIRPENLETLRYAVRSYENSGFVFIVNFQDHIENIDLNDIRIVVEGKDEEISFPISGTFDLPKAASAIFPFNLNAGEAVIKSATVQPLTILKKPEKDYYIFSSIEGVNPEMAFSAQTKISKLKNASKKRIGTSNVVFPETNKPFSFEANGVSMLVIPQEMAMNALKIREDLFISKDLLLADGKDIQLISRNTSCELHRFPHSNEKASIIGAKIDRKESTYEGFMSYEVSFRNIKPEVKIQKASNRKYSLKLNSDISDLHDVFLEVDYIGDRAMAFIDGKMVTDHFYHEKKWEISLRKFSSDLQNSQMVLVFHPMYSDYKYMKDLTRIPDFSKGSFLKINGIELIPEYKASLHFDE